jgi:hypothetical protein
MNGKVGAAHQKIGRGAVMVTGSKKTNRKSECFDWIQEAGVRTKKIVVFF